MVSKGRTLIVDTDDARAIACGKTLNEQGLTCTLLVTNVKSGDASIPGPSALSPRKVGAVSISGAFGGFSATVTTDGKRKHLAEWPGDEAAVFDLVLDLQPITSFAGVRLPLGYYAPGPDPAALDEAIAELPEMQGRFKKPQFTTFQESRCLRGRSRTLECRRCLEVCPYGAIQSADRKVSINHYLCQGCGGCAMVCPADAIRLAQPSQDELLNTLRCGLESRISGACAPPTLVISDAEAADNNGILKRVGGDDGSVVHFKVEQIGHVRLEMILAAFAYGAGKVLVICGPQNPPGIVQAAEWQAQMAAAILRVLKPDGENQVCHRHGRKR